MLCLRLSMGRHPQATKARNSTCSALYVRAVDRLSSEEPDRAGCYPVSLTAIRVPLHRLIPAPRRGKRTCDADHGAAGTSGGVSMSASRLSDIRTAATFTECRPRCAYRAVVCTCV